MSDESLSGGPGPGMAGAPPPREKPVLEQAMAILDSVKPAPDTETPDTEPNEMRSAVNDALGSEPQGEQRSDQPWSRDDIRDAVQALKRSGTPDDVIRDLAERDLDRLVNWGLDAAENVSARDRDYGQRNSDRREDVAPAMPTTDPSFEYKLPDEVRAKLEDGPAKALEQSIKDGFTRLQSKYEDVSQSTVNSALELSRERLSTRYPMLRNDRDYTRVREDMRGLVEAGHKFESFEAMMDRAAFLRFGSGANATRQPNRRRELGARKAGQPNGFVRSGGAQRKMTQDEFLDSLLARQDRGVSGDALRKEAEALRPYVDRSTRNRRPAHLRLPQI